MKLLAALAALLKGGKHPASPQSTGMLSGTARDDALEAGSVSRLLESVLRQAGLDARQSGEAVSLPSGLTLHVELLETDNFAEGQVRSSVRVVAVHQACFPEGLPEFLHSTGATLEQAIASGFSAWAKMDLVTLQDAIRAKPQDCTVMEMTLPAEGGGKPRVRQVILGPVGQLAAAPGPAGEAHPFCPCCMITHSMDVFRPYLQADGFLGIRLFASRNAEGALVADCRVNGEGFPAGVERLIEYARSWPQRGFEFRKQYVVIRPA